MPVVSRPARVSLYGHFAVKCSPLQSRQTTLPAPARTSWVFTFSSGVASGSVDYGIWFNVALFPMSQSTHLVARTEFQCNVFSNRCCSPIWPRFASFLLPKFLPFLALCYGMLDNGFLKCTLGSSGNLQRRLYQYSVVKM